jgi:hypothetical protein
MSRASVLFRLQETDLELDAHRARLDEIEAALSDSTAVREAQQQVVEAEARRHMARVNLRGLEETNQALDEKIAEVEQRLYGGAVTHTKELQDLQRELESLRRRRAASEEQQLEALIGLEAAESQLLSVQTLLSQTEAEVSKTQGDLIAERGQVRARIAQLEGEREAVLASIPAPDQAEYERLRRSKHGRAVTRLEDGVCAACGVAPSSSRSQIARQGGELIRCGNCGRILYAE